MPRLEQLQSLPPGLQMMLLNTEEPWTCRLCARVAPRHFGQALAGGYEERLMEAVRDASGISHGAAAVRLSGPGDPVQAAWHGSRGHRPHPVFQAGSTSGHCALRHDVASVLIALPKAVQVD